MEENKIEKALLFLIESNYWRCQGTSLTNLSNMETILKWQTSGVLSYELFFLSRIMKN